MDQNSAESSAIVPFAATGAAAELQALADSRMQPERTITFPKSAVGDVKIKQQPGTSLGAYAWFAGIELVSFLEKLFGQGLAKNHILELGSGTGLTAIALARLGAKVVATDNMPELVRLARKNAVANDISTDRFRALVYEWGKPLPAHNGQPFNLIVASEVTALESGHKGLLQTLQDTVKATTSAGEAPPQIFLAETRRNSQQPKFWEIARSSFDVQEVATVEQTDSWNTLDSKEPVRIFELQAREVVSLKAKDVHVPVASTDSVSDTIEVYKQIFRPEEKLDPYDMSFNDISEFRKYGYQASDIGKLSTYGAVLHHGLPTMFQAIANGAYDGDLHGAVEGKVFLDLGSAEGRCVISAALHFSRSDVATGDERQRPQLKEAIGVELSSNRHQLALRHRARINNESVRDRVTVRQDDILSESTGKLIQQADVVYAANLRFPEEVNRNLGAHLTANLDPHKDCFLLALAPLDFQGRKPTSHWEFLVPMTWNPTGWPVYCHHFQSNLETRDPEN